MKCACKPVVSGTISRVLLALFALVPVATITACSSSETATSGIIYSGNTAQAQIDGDNAETIGMASGFAAVMAIQADSLNQTSPLPVGVNVTAEDSGGFDETLAEVIQQIGTDSLTSLPTGFDYDPSVTNPSFCGGTIAIPNEQLPNLLGSEPLSVSFTFNNLCYDRDANPNTIQDRIVINGGFKTNPDGTSTILQYRNLSVTNFQGRQSVNAAVRCESTPPACTLLTDKIDHYSDFVGSDGRIHRIEGYIVESPTGPIHNVSGNFFHPAFGVVSMEATNIAYGNCGALPHGGNVTLTGAGGSSGTITFQADCTYSGTWNNGQGGVGSF